MSAEKAKKWADDATDKPTECREVSWWMDAATPEDATPDPNVLALQAVKDCSLGRISLTQMRNKLNEIFARLQSDILPPIEDVATLISKPIILPEPVIENVAHRGEKLSIGGASKAFKTWILSDLAVSVATGTLWLGHFQTTRGRVLHLNFELLAPYFAQRL